MTPVRRNHCLVCSVTPGAVTNSVPKLRGFPCNCLSLIHPKPNANAPLQQVACCVVMPAPRLRPSHRAGVFCWLLLVQPAGGGGERVQTTQRRVFGARPLPTVHGAGLRAIPPAREEVKSGYPGGKGNGLQATRSSLCLSRAGQPS